MSIKSRGFDERDAAVLAAADKTRTFPAQMTEQKLANQGLRVNPPRSQLPHGPNICRSSFSALANNCIIRDNSDALYKAHATRARLVMPRDRGSSPHPPQAKAMPRRTQRGREYHANNIPAPHG